MSDSKKTDHWSSLASLLGMGPAKTEPAAASDVKSTSDASVPKSDADATVVSAEPAISGELSLDASSTSPAAEEPKAAETPAPRRGNHWSKLANLLGLSSSPESKVEAKPEPVPPAAKTAEATLASLFVPTMPVETDDKSSRSSTRMIDDVTIDSTVEDAYLGEDESDSGDEPSDTSEAAVRPADENTEDGAPRRRRRRRRRRRGGRSAEGTRDDRSSPSSADRNDDGNTVRQSEDADNSGDDENESLDQDESSDSPQSADAPTRDAGSDSDSGNRPRRRRRRRRGRRRDGETAADAKHPDSRSETRPSEAPARDEVASKSSVRSRTEDHDDDPDDIEPIDDHEIDDASSDDPHDSHRKIPTWDEAVGILIASNMEARTRNPRNDRGGGGRDRDRGRGRRP